LIVQADARRIPLADGSVHCCITSPPYWGLRSYGLETWVGGSGDCDHLGPPKNTQAGFNERYTGKPPKDEDKQGELRVPYRGTCGKCGAQSVDSGIGLEKTPGCGRTGSVRLRRDLSPDRLAFVLQRLLAVGLLDAGPSGMGDRE